jgi:hypothetical protein
MAIVAKDEDADDPVERVLRYQDDLIGFFTGGSMDGGAYPSMRQDLMNNPIYAGKAPTFLRRIRDTGALWSFAKSVDPSWEPRRQYLRLQFEPLLDYLESEQAKPQSLPAGPYNSSAWTGAKGTTERAKAIRTLLPVAQAAIGALIADLEKPSHNGGPPLDEVEEAVNLLRQLHAKLGELLNAVEDGKLGTQAGEGLIVEAARYGKRAARALRHDPMPYATAATVLAIMASCGFPSIGGYLSAVALMIQKPRQGQ